MRNFDSGQEALSEQMTFEQRPDRMSKAATWGGCRYRCRNHKYPGPGDTGVRAQQAQQEKTKTEDLRSGLGGPRPGLCDGAASVRG